MQLLVTGPNHISLPRQQKKLAFTLEDVLTQKECEALICSAEETGFMPAGLGASGLQEVNTTVRNSYRILADDRWLSSLLWQRVQSHIPVVWDGRWVIGPTERLRFLRYKKGQYFAPHRDGCFRRPGTENC